ncbi:MAG: hypothetical protein BSOLF_0249 [Candidatus Carbobacillus altaicus]|uniref:Sporulation protein YtfJ n=1 Tax=Candidatus Carbonibacillus altaicus TaxID=2163959 RepID=A0A2R6Y168_9BACL|nr:MAG: hypothetical protein BSOLF_0249 [Candidatus Carbobacillus altaicus]
MQEHPIQGLMGTAMENLKGMIDVSTIIGEPVVTPDGSTVLPISKVGFGFAAGGSEFDLGSGSDADLPFGGGSGGGVSIQPVGFLVISKSDVRFIPLEPTVHLYDRLLDALPKAVDKINDLIRGGGGGQGQKKNDTSAQGQNQ